MDDTDSKILDILKDEGRASFTDIAEEVDVTEATVRNRIESMEQENVIKRFTVETSVKDGVGGFVALNINSDASPEEVYDKFPETEIYELSGKYDAFAKLVASNRREFNKLLDEIRAKEGVDYTETFMILNKG